jgi:threonine/homoserine/homoserine lactone efflux protein
MSFEQLIPVAFFVIAMVGTPGPNNLMLLTAGANFGFRRSLPHILGITAGCQVLLLAIALGLGQLFSAWPTSVVLLKLAGSGFLVYMALQLLRPRAAALGETGEVRPLSFLQAALFQWVNPKAWLMLITGLATYVNPAQMALSTLLIGITFAVVGLPLTCLWNVGGVALKDWLQHGRRLLHFNRLMAALLLASLVPLLV